jgi:cell division septation protein DedD
MDNRDDEEDRLEAVTPSDNDDWTDDEEGDTYSISSGLRDDLSEANAMDDDLSRSSDPDTSDDMVARDEDDASEAPEKDWLVDSGLAAAIRPETAEAEPAADDDLEENTESLRSASLWSDAEGEPVGREEDIDDEDFDDEDSDADEDFDEDDFDDEDPEDDQGLEDDELEDTPPGSDETDLSDYTTGPYDDQGGDSVGAADASSERPVWPMLVGLIAVVLISVGGWGLFEERAALQARIVELERSQSQVSSVNAVDASTLSALEADNASLKLQLDGLYRDYELAMMEIANLQDASETAAQIAVDALEPTSTDTEEPAAAAPDAATMSNADQAAGSWFVNVGAYSVAQSAENLAETLNGGGFDTIVQEVSTDDGSVLLRVRVIGLEEKTDAQQVAAELEASYGIGPVWVGQTPTTP